MSSRTCITQIMYVNLHTLVCAHDVKINGTSILQASDSKQFMNLTKFSYCIPSNSPQSLSSSPSQFPLFTHTHTILLLHASTLGSNLGPNFTKCPDWSYLCPCTFFLHFNHRIVPNNIQTSAQMYCYKPVRDKNCQLICGLDLDLRCSITTARTFPYLFRCPTKHTK